MKKNIFVIAAVALGLVGSSAYAQDTKTTCTGEANCPAAQAAGQNNKMRQPKSFTEFAFEGILLEPAQQQRIDSLNQAFEAQRPACKEGKEGKCNKEGKACKEGKEGKCKEAKACKEAKCKDCAQCNNGQDCANCTNCNDGKQCDKEGKKCNKEGKPACDRKDPRREYSAKVKEILTPEQYVIYLENIAFMPEQGGPKGDGRQVRPSRGGKLKAQGAPGPKTRIAKDAKDAKGVKTAPAVKATGVKEKTN